MGMVPRPGQRSGTICGVTSRVIGVPCWHQAWLAWCCPLASPAPCHHCWSPPSVPPLDCPTTAASHLPLRGDQQSNRRTPALAGLGPVGWGSSCIVCPLVVIVHHSNPLFHWSFCCSVNLHIRLFLYRLYGGNHSR